jgi:oligoribonuclease NrnB/cAMP/cGMP phosphodiesterase (DHH superfamily)
MTTVLYHFPCKDGFTAAWLANKYLKVDEFIPCPVNLTPSQIKDKDVLMLDVCFSRTNMKKLVRDARKVTVYDHHKTALPILQELAEKYNKNKFDYVYDINKCGSMITLEQLHIGRKPEKYLNFVSYIQDKDLWIWKNQASKEIDAYISLYDYTFENWDYLKDKLASDFSEMVRDGSTVLRYKDRLVKQIIEMTMQKNEEGVISINSPVLQSEIGNEVASKGKYVKIWHTNNKNNESVSLRSEGDFDVSEIAKKYGGGGHKNSAGYNVTNETKKN